MTKAKTTAAEAETPPVDTTTEGQDTLQAASGEDPALFQAEDATEETPPSPTEEQEAARLEVEAMLAAQAEADAAAAAAGETPTLDFSTLTYLAAQIDMLNTTGHRLGLVDELIGLYQAEIDDRDDEGVTVTMQGISIDPADCMENALTNWASAARRAVLGATA